MTIVEFLLARLAQDEAEINEARISESPDWWEPSCWSRKRALAEIKAKRRIVEHHSLVEFADGRVVCDVCSESGTWDPYPCRTLQMIAAVYEDHPDYNNEWAVA